MVRANETIGTNVAVVNSDAVETNVAVVSSDAVETNVAVLRGETVETNETTMASDAVDMNVVARQSLLARQVLLQTSPEIVTAAEGFAEDVTYVPVTSVGWNVSVDARSGLPAIRPSEAAPYWATVPLLYGLSRSIPGLIPTITKRKTEP